MKQKSIKTHARLLTCLVALAVVFATFFAGTFTTNAGTNVFEDVELRIGDTLGFIYYTTQPYTENAKMKFTINGRTSETDAYNNNNKCVFVFNDIYPHELAKEVTATIIVDGKEIVTSTGLSMKSFLLEMLLDEQYSDDYHKLASNILQYGEQTRLYRNANVDVKDRDPESIIDFSTSIYKNYKPDNINDRWEGTAHGLGVSASTIRLSSIGVAYYNANQYVLTLKTPSGSAVNLSTVEVMIGNKVYKSNSFVSKGNGEYEIRSAPINAYEVPNPVTIQLKVNGSVVQQASYSPYDYVYQLQNTTSDNSLAMRYAKSLCHYGKIAQEVYNGTARIVAIQLKENPTAIAGPDTIQKPTGGKIWVVYADGKEEAISEGIDWSTTDINGNNIKIEGDEYQKIFEIIGIYTDPSNGKEFIVNAKVTLINNLTSIERWTDPVYEPTEYKATYNPGTVQVKCTWANGYTAIRGASCADINMSAYKSTEYAQIKTTATYANPKHPSTEKTADVYVLYKNPITSLNIDKTTVNFDNGAFIDTATPSASTFTLTYANGQTTDKKQTSETGFSWTAFSYNGTATNFESDAEGKWSCPTYPSSGKWTVYTEGKQDKNVSFASRTVTAKCKVTVKNPEKYIKINELPTIKGGAVTSTTAPESGTTKGSLTGGKTQLITANGAAKDVNASYKCSDGIADATYSKTVNITAYYGGFTAKKEKAITLYNTLSKVEVSNAPKIKASSNKNKSVQLTRENLAGTLTVTYSNGVTATNTAENTSIYFNGSSHNDNCYIQNITTNHHGFDTSARNKATTTKDSNAQYNLQVVYTDTRKGSNATKTINYYAYVYNPISSIVSGQYTDNVTMTSASAVPTPANKNLTVVLANGKTTSLPCSFTKPAVVTGAVEMQEKNVTATCAQTYTINGQSVSERVTGTVKTRVINPAVSAVTHTDPEAYQVTGTGQVDGSKLKGGKITVKFINGQTGTFDCSGYTTTTDTKIADTTKIRKVKISGHWGEYAKATATDMHVVLTNPATSATLVLSTGASTTNRITLGTNGARPTGTATVKYSNGKTTTGHTCTVQTIGVGGAVNNTTATKSYEGTCKVTASLTVAASATQTRKTGNTTVNVSVQATPLTTSQTTAYWKNTLQSASQVSASCNAIQHANTNITCTDNNCTVVVKATYTNGATEEFKQDSGALTVTGSVNNITDTTKSATRTGAKATLSTHGGTKTINLTMTVNNPVTKMVVNNRETEFPGNSNAVTNCQANVTFQNGRTATVKPSSVTTSTDNSINGDATHDYNNSNGNLTCTYNGNKDTGWTSTFYAVYRNASDYFTITYKNPLTVTAYIDAAKTTKVAQAEGKTGYAIFKFDNGDTKTISGYENVYIDLKFANGKTSDIATEPLKHVSDMSGNALQHNYSSMYKNGDNYVATAEGSLISIKFTYTIDDETKHYTCYGYTITGKKSSTCSTKGLKQKTTNTSGGIGPSSWKTYISGTNQYKNGKQSNVEGSYSIGTNANNRWYIQNRPNNTSNTLSTRANSNTNPYETGSKQVSNISNWSTSYVSVRHGTSVTINGKTYSISNANRYTYWTKLTYLHP